MLNVGERILTLQVLPAENDYSTIRIIRGLKEKFGLSPEDHEEFEIQKYFKYLMSESKKLAEEANKEENKDKKEDMLAESEFLAEKSEELKKKGLENIVWNAKGDEEKEFELKNKELEIIKSSLEKLSKEKKLSSRHLSIYEKFVKPEESE